MYTINIINTQHYLQYQWPQLLHPKYLKEHCIGHIQSNSGDIFLKFYLAESCIFLFGDPAGSVEQPKSYSNRGSGPANGVLQIRVEGEFGSSWRASKLLHSCSKQSSPKQNETSSCEAKKTEEKKNNICSQHFDSLDGATHHLLLTTRKQIYRLVQEIRRT